MHSYRQHLDRRILLQVLKTTSSQHQQMHSWQLLWQTMPHIPSLFAHPVSCKDHIGIAAMDRFELRDDICNELYLYPFQDYHEYFLHHLLLGMPFRDANTKSMMRGDGVPVHTL